MAQPKTRKDAGTMIFLVIVLLLTLVGAGTGFAVGSLVQSPADTERSGEKPNPDDSASVSEAGEVPKVSHAASKGSHTNAHDELGKTPSDGQEESDGPVDPRSLKVAVFPPVLTTLAEPKGKWIRLEGSILITSDAQEPSDVLANRSGEQILTYLRSLRLHQLEGPSGVLGLREDLTEMLRTLSQGQVKGILIHGLVVE